MKTITLLWTLFLCANLTAAENKEIMVELKVPDSAWTISIEEVYQVGNEVWVISRVSRAPDVFGLQVISTIKDSLTLAIAELPVKHFIVDKTWNWKNEEPYTFIKDLKLIEKDLMSGKQLYRKAKKQP
ncbi:MAG: hypothetical protein ACO3JG_08135 [Luteolibacter sp.]